MTVKACARTNLQTLLHGFNKHVPIGGKAIDSQSRAVSSVSQNKNIFQHCARCTELLATAESLRRIAV